MGYCWIRRCGSGIRIFWSSSTARLGPRGVDLLVQDDGLDDLAAHGEDRVERRHRLLENHGHAAAADLPHGRVGQRGQNRSVSCHPAGLTGRSVAMTQIGPPAIRPGGAITA